MEEYYYLDNNNQRIGPLSLTELIAKQINAHTLIWKNGLAQWTLAANVPEVAQLLPHFSTTPPPPPQSGTANRPCPPTNLIWGILCTIFCCLPLGIVAIYKSSRVEHCYYAGDYEGAVKASKSAVNWCIAGIVITILGCAIYFGFFFMMVPFALM